MVRLFLITTFFISSVYQQIFPIITGSQNQDIISMQKKLNEYLLYGDNRVAAGFNSFKKKLKDRYLCLELLNFREDDGTVFLDGVRKRIYMNAYREISLYLIEDEAERQLFLDTYVKNAEDYINCLTDEAVKGFLSSKLLKYKIKLKKDEDREIIIEKLSQKERQKRAVLADEQSEESTEEETVITGIDGQEMSLARAIEVFSQGNLFEK